MSSEEKYIVPSGTRIGHVHLKVSDLQRALDFYCGMLGFEVMTKLGDDAAFISAGGYHHHIGLNTWQSKGKPPAPKNQPGLFHTAIVFPTRKDLAYAVNRL
ncbi:MAG: catechol 2,3-dioxygenase, partial [Flavobacteriaceae bacterium]